METGNALRFVEEDSHGWTILSTTEGEDLVSSLALRKEDVSREETMDGAGDDDDRVEEDYQESGEVKKGEDGPMFGQGKRVFDSESADLKDKERSPFDGVTNAHVADGVANGDVGVDKGYGDDDGDGKDENTVGNPYIGGQKNLPWKNLNPNEEEEEGEDDDDEGEEYERKKGDLEGHLNNKNGCVFWRASFFATLGFLGWVIINNTFNGGSGKDLRCMKLHPCAIKGGGAHHVLDSV